MGKTSAFLLVLLFLAASCYIADSTTPAKSKTIVVPDDYPIISSAIANATDGDTIFVKKGTYEGPINQSLVIDKSLSLIGEDTENTIIKLYPAYNVTWIFATPFFSYSDAITITANDCKLLNLTVIIANPGGYISATGNRIQIIGNNITTGPTTGVIVNGSYCKITDNVIGGRIQLNGSFSEVARNSLSCVYIDGSWNIIKDNVCKHLGLGYYSNHTTNNVVSGNIVATSTRSYSGISLTNSNNNFFCRNHVSGFGYGLTLWFSSGNTITANTIADSLDSSISLGGSFNNRIYLNNFMDNMWGGIPYVYDYYTDPWVRDGNPDMMVSTNFWDNGSVGNYWGDYNGSDANGDGIGDLPYTIKIVVSYFDRSEEEFVCGRDNFPLMTPVDIYGVIIELPEWSNPILTPAPKPDLSPHSNPIPEPNPSPSPNPVPELTPTPQPQQPEPSPTKWMVLAVSSVAVVGAGITLYLKKVKKKQ